MQRRRATQACAFALLAVAATATPALAQEKPDQAQLENELQKLLHERVETANVAKDAVQAAYDAATVTLPYLIDTLNKLRDARLAVAATPAEEIDVLEDHLKRMQQTEQKVAVLHREGLRGGEAKDYFTVKRERETAQIDLLRARLKASP
jgi:hypothetical protein